MNLVSQVEAHLSSIWVVALDVVEVSQLLLPLVRVLGSHDPAVDFWLFRVSRAVLLIQLPLVQLHRRVRVEVHPSSFDNSSLGSHSLASLLSPALA